jgi:hypothetical protein
MSWRNCKPRSSTGLGLFVFKQAGDFTHIGPDHVRIEDEEKYYTEVCGYTSCKDPYKPIDEWLMGNLDTFEDVPGSVMWQKGCLEVIKLAMKPIPTFLRQFGRCELDIWDYNHQKILIDDDCNITTILYWDGGLLGTRTL